MCPAGWRPEGSLAQATRAQVFFLSFFPFLFLVISYLSLSTGLLALWLYFFLTFDRLFNCCVDAGARAVAAAVRMTWRARKRPYIQSLFSLLFSSHMVMQSIKFHFSVQVKAKQQQERKKNKIHIEKLSQEGGKVYERASSDQKRAVIVIWNQRPRYNTRSYKKKERKKEGKAANCDPAFLNRLGCCCCCSQFVGRGCDLTTVESRVSE